MIVVATGILLLLIGLTLAVTGARGSLVDLTPRCRRCDFDVSATLATSDRCPECGLVLTTRRAIRPGTRRRRPRYIAAGAALLMLGLALTAAPTIIRRAGIDINRHKPVWMLSREAMPSRWSPRSAPALSELARRCSASTLSRAQATAIAGRILRQQSADARPWERAHGDLFLELLPSITGGQAALHRYIRQLAALEVQTDIACFEDRPITIDLCAPAARFGTADSWWVTASIETCRINGVEIEIDEDDPRPFNNIAGRWFTAWFDGAVRFPFSVWADGVSGHADIELTWKIEAMTEKASVAIARGIQRSLDSGVKPEEIMQGDWEHMGAAEWTQSWSGSLVIEPPSQSRRVGLDVSVPLPEIDRCIRDVYVQAGRNPDGISVWVGGSFINPPLDLAYDVWIDTSHGTRRVGRIGALADESVRFSLSPTLDQLTDTQVTVRFVPAADYADRRQGMRLIDGRELVRRSIYVSWIR